MPPLYVFHHIPKCAGNSLKTPLALRFRLVGDYRARSSSNPAMWENVDTFRRRALNLDDLSPTDLLMGHFDLPGCRLWERYPDRGGREMRKIVFLRDPLDRAFSEFFVAANGAPMEARGETLGAHLMATRNPVAWLLEDPPETASDALGGYWFVGTVESLHRDVARLLRRLDRHPIAVPRFNATPRPDHALSPDLIAAFKARNALDYALHARARAISDADHLDTSGATA
jgi:hypothetical protein